MNRGPDGNSIFLDAPQGLILVDTGRHPEHAELLLAYARQREQPIVAILNTHWHLDHTTGNMDLLKAYPGVPIVASRAIEGKLFRNFIAPGRAQAKKALTTKGNAKKLEMIRYAQPYLHLSYDEHAADALGIAMAAWPLLKVEAFVTTIGRAS